MMFRRTDVHTCHSYWVAVIFKRTLDFSIWFAFMFILFLPSLWTNLFFLCCANYENNFVCKNIAIFIIMQKGRKLIWYQAAKLYNSLLIENIFEIILFYIGAVILREKTVADKLMNIPNDHTQNYPLCRLQFLV